MKLYFDTEFTGLHKETSLISIGIVSENNKVFYAEFTDYNRSQCCSWIKDNVLDNLRLDDITPNTINNASGEILLTRGNKSFIANTLKGWLIQFSEIQFVSDVCHYDFVLLIDLFGSALKLPSHISPACYDLNQKISETLKIQTRDAFNIDRDLLIDIEEMFCPSIPLYDISNDHNALRDALVIRAAYERLELLSSDIKSLSKLNNDCKLIIDNKMKKG